MKRKIVFGGIAIFSLVMGLGLVLKSCRQSAHAYSFETVKVTRGDISTTVTATGTIAAIKTVAVGTQVSGVIDKMYADFNSRVKKGQLLAQLDKTPLLANLESARATLEGAKAELTYQTSNYKRIKALYDKNMVAETDYDQALYTFKKAQASIIEAETNYDKAKINLGYASIYSPIDGVVLSRAVDEGQTVAASFSTPTLFSIANDLTQMQVQASIDEADIGMVKVGQRATFTVQSFPDLKFTGEVSQIRLLSTTTSNVVTYTVIIKAPNPDLKLLPGMTANITIFTRECSNTLLVASKVLRFKPDMLQVKDYLGSLSHDKRTVKAVPSMSPSLPYASLVGKNTEEQFADVWQKEGMMIHPVKVGIGIDNDMNVQIFSGLKEGDEVIIAMESNIPVSKETVKEGNSGSPFMPKPPSRKK
jgi:HlyD family secretion protein